MAMIETDFSISIKLFVKSIADEMFWVIKRDSVTYNWLSVTICTNEYVEMLIGDLERPVWLVVLSLVFTFDQV